MKNARKWKAFRIGADTYFAVASNHHHESPIYKWDESGDKGRFVLVQSLPTRKASDVENITIGDDVYLGVAIFRGPRSYIFKWDGKQFAWYQDLAANGADMESFHIDGSVYLATAGAWEAIT